MADWWSDPLDWTGDPETLILTENFPNSLPIDLKEIIKKSDSFPVKFPIDTSRCCQLKEKVSSKALTKNINSAYPIIHERGLYLCALFLVHQRKFSPRAEFYEEMTLLQLVDRLLKKRAVVFLERADHYLLLNGEGGTGSWETIGTDHEKKPLILEDCLSYNEIKLSALLSVSSYSFFINDGDRNNRGKYEENREKVEEEGVIVGLIGTRFEKPNVMEYQEVIKTKEQNLKKYGYGGTESIQKLFLEFYGGSYQSYEELEDDMNRQPERYKSLGRGRFFDKEMYKKRISISIDTLLIEANDRALKASKKAFIHVVGLGLGVWKIYEGQNEIFMETFAKRLEALSEVLPNISDIRFSYIGGTKAGGYKNGDKIKEITIHIVNENPQVNLKDEGKLLVVSYPWDGNALPGNEFWLGNLDGSGDPAAACSSQIAELHNSHINGKVSGANLRVATPDGVVTFREYQELVKRRMLKRTKGHL